MNTAMILRRQIFKFMFIATIVVMLFVLLFPVFVLITTSLKMDYDVLRSPVIWFPKPLHWENYIEVFTIMGTLTGFKSSIVVTGLSIVCILLFGIPAAFAMSWLDFYGKKIITYVTIASQMFAPVIVIVPLYNMLRNAALIDNWFGLAIMNTVFNLAFIVLMLKSTFDGIPREVIDAAKIDGCTTFGTMTKIFVPIGSTGIVIAVIFAFTRCWNEFLFAFTFTSTTSKKTIIVRLYEILRNNPSEGSGIPWQLVMAGAVLTTIPIVSLFISIRNYITGGHTAGAIK